MRAEQRGPRGNRPITTAEADVAIKVARMIAYRFVRTWSLPDDHREEVESAAVVGALEALPGHQGGMPLSPYLWIAAWRAAVRQVTWLRSSVSAPVASTRGKGALLAHRIGCLSDAAHVQDTKRLPDSELEWRDFAGALFGRLEVLAASDPDVIEVLARLYTDDQIGDLRDGTHRRKRACARLRADPVLAELRAAVGSL